eukprot:1329763-Pleurochrysis_carterae.AAC.1
MEVIFPDAYIRGEYRCTRASSCSKRVQALVGAHSYTYTIHTRQSRTSLISYFRRSAHQPRHAHGF